MIEIYNSNQATRAINTYYDFVGSEDMENKELLVLTLIAYEGQTSAPFIKRVMGVNADIQIDSLEKKGLIKMVKNMGRARIYDFTYEPKSAEVVAESKMYLFTNALFNIGKYLREYKITSWNNIATLVEIPLKMDDRGKVQYDLDLIDCIGGNKANKIYNRGKLISMGVLKNSGNKADHLYRVNEHAYLMGVRKEELV